MRDLKVGDRVEWISTDNKIKVLSRGIVQFVTKAAGAGDTEIPLYVVGFRFGRYTLPGRQLALVSSIPGEDVRSAS